MNEDDRREDEQIPASTFSGLDAARIRSLLTAQRRIDSDTADDRNRRQDRARATVGPNHDGTERRLADRRHVDRRRLPSTSADVTRLEHENLYGQVEELVRLMRRVEGELHDQRDRIVRIETAIETLSQRRSESL
jgi:hypothetical protein